MRKINLIIIRLCIFSTFILPACSDSNRSETYYSKAKICYGNKDFLCAKSELEKAVDIDPNFAGAYANLGEVYLKLGRVSESLNAYVKAAELAPNQPEVQLKLATLYMLNKNTFQARKILESLISNNPDNLTANYLMAEFYVMEKDYDRSEKLFRRITIQDPSQIRAYLNLASILTKKQKFDIAEQILISALNINPSSLHATIALYNLYANQQKFLQAEKLLQQSVLMNPETKELHILLGNLYFIMAKWEQSETEYLKAIKISPQNPETYIISGNFYSSINQPDQALAMYQKAITIQPDNPSILMYLARFHLANQNIRDSEKFTEKMLLQNPNYFPAQILKCENLIAQNEWDNAIFCISELIQKYPEASQLYHLKGISYLKKNETDLAKIEFGKIPPGSSEYINAKLMLAGIFISENNFLQAKESAETILNLSPKNYPALKLLGNIYLLENHFDKAKSYFSKLIELSPRNPDGFFLLGLLNKRQQNYDDAINNFEAALAKGHADIRVFVNLIATLLEKNMIDNAITRCDDAIQKMKEQPNSQAVILDLKGKLYLAQNRIPLAEKSFKSAIISNPNYLPPYYSLANIYFSEGREDSAIKQYESAIGNNSVAQPELPNMMLGIIFSMKNQTNLAEYHYRKALEFNQDFAPAANNLAYLLAEQDRNLDEALRLVQNAKRNLPDDPRVMDTLGWVYVKIGFYQQAIQTLSESIRTLPDNATLHFHLGIAYFKNGEKKEARRSFEYALSLDNNFSGADQARAILEDI